MCDAKRKEEGKHSAVYADEFVVSIADELRGTDAHGSTHPTSSQVVVRVLGAMACGHVSMGGSASARLRRHGPCHRQRQVGSG